MHSDIHNDENLYQEKQRSDARKKKKHLIVFLDLTNQQPLSSGYFEIVDGKTRDFCANACDIFC